jgi:hypothetical protein
VAVIVSFPPKAKAPPRVRNQDVVARGSSCGSMHLHDRGLLNRKRQKQCRQHVLPGAPDQPPGKGQIVAVFRTLFATDRQDMAAGLPNPASGAARLCRHHLIQINFAQPMGDYC